MQYIYQQTVPTQPSDSTSLLSPDKFFNKLLTLNQITLTIVLAHHSKVMTWASLGFWCFFGLLIL